jgi:hypothetical protein
MPTQLPTAVTAEVRACELAKDNAAPREKSLKLLRLLVVGREKLVQCADAKFGLP